MESPGSRRANFHNNPMTCVKVKGHDVIRMNTLTRQPLGGWGGTPTKLTASGCLPKKVAEQLLGERSPIFVQSH